MRPSRTRAYVAWVNMRQRCLRPSHKYFHYYGGRGIKICDRWSEFANFLADMGQPGDGLTLDRTDNDGPYSPENCRWIPHAAQQANTRKVRFVEFNGEKIHLREASRRANLKWSTMMWRMQNWPQSEWFKPTKAPAT